MLHGSSSWEAFLKLGVRCAAGQWIGSKSVSSLLSVLLFAQLNEKRVLYHGGVHRGRPILRMDHQLSRENLCRDCRSQMTNFRLDATRYLAPFQVFLCHFQEFPAKGGHIIIGRVWLCRVCTEIRPTTSLQMERLLD